jgi:hypothetical protein
MEHSATWRGGYSYHAVTQADYIFYAISIEVPLPTTFCTTLQHLDIT